MPSPTHDRPRSFYDHFERKDGDQTTTHYCPGCGHGNVHKFIAEALDDFGVADRTIFVNPVGCSVFAYYYLDIGHIQAAHGRAPAVATAVKRARPDSIVLCYQGDGDLAAIGGNEILQAANRGESITVIFINNALYGMTGGQMAPTSLLGQRTTTTPFGRAANQEGFPLRVVELFNALEAPVYLERVAIGDAKRDMTARKAVRKAIRNQIEGRGFSLVEILSPCPTGWKLTPASSATFVLDTMTKTFPIGVVRDRSVTPSESARGGETGGGGRGGGASGDGAAGRGGTTGGATGLRRLVPLEDIPAALGHPGPAGSAGTAPIADWPAGEILPRYRDPRIKAAGFGGQGVLFLGALIAEAGMLAGRAVSWLPSYGPEMRGGTAHCHIILSEDELDSPLVTRASVLLAFNGPSLERFLADVVDGGLVVYDSSLIPHPPRELSESGRVETIAVPCTTIAEGIGSSRVANLVALGAYIARTRIIPPGAVESALGAHRLEPKTVALNMRALEAGMSYGS